MVKDIDEPTLVEQMIGRRISTPTGRTRSPGGEAAALRSMANGHGGGPEDHTDDATLLKVQNVSSPRGVTDVSLEVHAGEVLGLSLIHISKCLSNTRQMSLAMTYYANDQKDWYPLIPFTSTALTSWRGTGGQRPFLEDQGAYGGVAGLFSLYQVGDGEDVGYGIQFDPLDPNVDRRPRYVYANNSRIKNRTPLLAPYLEGFEPLVCPADKIDYYYGQRPPPSGPFGGPPWNPRLRDATPHTPEVPSSTEDVVYYNISYLYISGMRTDEPVIVTPAPLWGDETNGPDQGIAAWYYTENNHVEANTEPGFFGPEDNHGTDGGAFAFTDGHSEFINGSVNIREEFYSKDGTNPQSITVIDKDRDRKTYVMD